MGELKSYTKEEAGVCTLTLVGAIDEDAQLQDMEMPAVERLMIDFGGIEAINSCGIREWIKWIQSVSSEVKIEFKNCPKIIVDQINMVAGFLPTGAEVQSFYVPYYCEATGSEKMMLFQAGENYKGGEVFPCEGVKDDETGDEMEMDVLEVKYFKFIKK